MYVQTIYRQDFTLDFHEIRWSFGRAWDWANFCESHEKFVRFGNSAWLVSGQIWDSQFSAQNQKPHHIVLATNLKLMISIPQLAYPVKGMKSSEEILRWGNVFFGGETLETLCVNNDTLLFDVERVVLFLEILYSPSTSCFSCLWNKQWNLGLSMTMTKFYKIIFHESNTRRLFLTLRAAV